MHDIVISLVIPAAFAVGLASARGSILALLWICFQRPQDFSYGIWNELPVFQIALAIAIVSNAVRGQLKLSFPPVLVIYLALLGWGFVSCFYAFDSKHAFAFYGDYVPSMVVTPIVLFATVHDLRLWKWAICVSAGALVVNGMKVGAVLGASGGASDVLYRSAVPLSGFVGDNNVFALALVVAIAIALGLRSLLPRNRWLHAAYHVGIGLNVLTVIFTKSRGAALSLGVVLVLSALLRRQRLRRISLVAMLALGALLIVPSQYFQRLTTLPTWEADASATGRLDNWALSWHEALEHPLTGVGPDNHMLYNRGHGGVVVRVAHSIYFQTLGELGFPGLALYLLFVMVGGFVLFATWREMTRLATDPSHTRFTSRPRFGSGMREIGDELGVRLYGRPGARRPAGGEDLGWTQDVAFWMFCAYAGFVFGSAFLNMFYIEFPWYLLFFGAMLRPLVRREIAVRTAETGLEPSRSLPATPGYRTCA